MLPENVRRCFVKIIILEEIFDLIMIVWLPRIYFRQINIDSEPDPLTEPQHELRHELALKIL